MTDLAPLARLVDVISTTGLVELPHRAVRSLLAAADAVLDARDALGDDPDSVAVVGAGYANAVTAFLVDDSPEHCRALHDAAQEVRVVLFAATVEALN